jgi:hypothetical protein
MMGASMVVISTAGPGSSDETASRADDVAPSFPKERSMADWNALREHLKANYQIAKDEIDTIHLMFETEDGRSQVVFVSRTGELGGSDWAEIATAVCAEADIDPRDALLRSGRMIAGGLVLMEDGPVVYRHAFPLAGFDLEDLEVPLHLVALMGDDLEKELTGEDRY